MFLIFILLDFPVAFDIIDHFLFIETLSSVSLLSLLFSYLSENSYSSFGGLFYSTWLINVQDLQSCLIFSLYTLSLGNLIHAYGMYLIFISLLR